MSRLKSLEGYATDIWESEADFQAFAKEQLMPMAGAFAEERGGPHGMGLIPHLRKPSTSTFRDARPDRVQLAEYGQVLRPACR